MPKQIYSESEISTILQTAAKIQEQEAASAYAPGVTYEELLRIAQECGIGEDALKLAITQPEQHTEQRFLNLVETHERVFDGELDFDRLDEVVEALGSNAKIQFSQQLGRSIRCQVSAGTVWGRLELTSRNGRTKLKFTQVPFIAYFGGLHGPLIASIVLGANLMAHGLIWPGLFAMIAILSIGALIFRYLAETGKKKARTLVDDMSQAIIGLLAEDSPRSKLESAAPAIEAAAEEGAELSG